MGGVALEWVGGCGWAAGGGGLGGDVCEGGDDFSWFAEHLVRWLRCVRDYATLFSVLCSWLAILLMLKAWSQEFGMIRYARSTGRHMTRS